MNINKTNFLFKISVLFFLSTLNFSVSNSKEAITPRITDYKNFAIVISGPSGVGKTTIIDNFVLKHMDEINVSISATTRQKRGTEINGKDYYFISKDSFKRLIKKNELLEYDKNYENYYGSPIRNYIESMFYGKDVIFNLSTGGMQKVKQRHPEFDFVTIFIAPPSMDVLYKRLKSRNTETEEQIKKRFNEAKREIDDAKKFDYIVYNCNIEDSVKMIETIYLAEQRKREFKRDI